MIVNKEKIKKILILRSDGIGDFILSFSALNILRNHFPHAYICLFTGSWQEEIARVSKLFNEIITWDNFTNYYLLAPHRLKYYSHSMLRYIPRLRSYKFDLGIDFRNDDFRNRIIMWLSQVKIRLGFNRGGLEFLLTHIIPDRKEIHKSLRFLELITSFTGSKENLHFRLNVSYENIRKANDFLYQEGVSGDDLLIVIHPVARWPAKTWSKENFAELGNRLLGLSGVKVVLMGAKEDVAKINEIKDMMHKNPIISAGRLSFMESAGLIEKAKVFIGNDAAPMQLGAMLGIPTIGLFGPTEPEVFGPGSNSAKSFFMRKIDAVCPKCPRKYCIYPDRFCMDKISVEEVYVLAKQFLS